jgi:hypothetical protein
MLNRPDILHLQDKKVLFCNFRGEPGTYNERGDRTFSVVIDDLDEAEQLLADGWALKPLRNEEDEVDAYHLPIKVNFNSRRPPRIYKASLELGQRLMLNEQTIAMLDYLPIDYVDVDVNPSVWNVRGETGIKAYCQAMYVIVEETPLDARYAGLKDYSESNAEDLDE